MRVGLRFKVSAFAALLVLAVAAAMAYFFVYQAAQRREREAIAHHKAVARLISLLQRVDSKGEAKLDFPKVETLVRNAVELENGLVFAMLVTGEGDDLDLSEGVLNEELWIGLGDDLGDALDSRGATGVLIAIAGEEIPFERRVKEFRTELPGGERLIVGFELGSLDTAQRRDLRANLFVALGALLLGLAGSLLLGRTLAGRMEELAAAMRKVARGDLTQKLKVRGSDEIGVAQSAFNVMTDELRRKQHYKETLGRYVSEDVAERLLEAPEQIDVTGEERQVTVLSLDVRGFAELARAMAPPQLLELLNQYFGSMIDVVFSAEGSITRFAGDSLMAVFGAPIAVDDQEMRAVSAAVQIQRVVAQLNVQRRSAREMEVGVGIGVSTGRVVAGNVGSERRLAYTVVGEPVNLATQLEELAQQGQILISRSTHEQVSGRIATIDLGPTELRGFTEAVSLFAVDISAGDV